MVSPLLIGRGVSPIRTPALIRDYLTGQGAFSDDPPEELAERLSQGAYVAQIHQRIKQYIRESRPKYQWPRRHSFNARINDLLMLGLLVETGSRAEPEHRGAGRLGTARGFSERVWVRLAPGAETRPEWADPLGFLIILKQREDPSSYHNIRTPGRVLATGVPVLAPALRRAPALRPVPALEPALTAVSTEGVRSLEEQRQTLQRAAQALAERGIEVRDFESLGRAAHAFDTTVVRVLALERTLFPDLAGALGILQNCVAGLAAQRQMTALRAQAVNNCRAGARLVAEALSPVLVDLVPRLAPPQQPPTEIGIVRQAFDRLVDSRPNSAFAERTLDRLEVQGVDVNDLTDARDALKEYAVIARSDYERGEDGAEEYKSDRESAWEAFLEALENTEGPEEEEEE